jgi:hypothetical protein
MAEHGVARNRMKNFRQRRTHPGTLASSENNDIEGHEKTTNWAAGVAVGGLILKKKKGSRGYPFSQSHKMQRD